jgi:hypothetical protein
MSGGTLLALAADEIVMDPNVGLEPAQEAAPVQKGLLF